MSDWTAFGRVDDDGTVYVKTAAGERVVGSWQAGTPEEGLAHFARRFADLVTEVDLIEARLESRRGRRRPLADHHPADPRLAGRGARRRRHRRPGRPAGQAGRRSPRRRPARPRAARDAARGEALARKTALVEEAEKIAAESTSWKTAGDRLKEILDEWKTIRGVDKKADGELWKRFAAARDGFTRRRGAHFATLDAQRKQAQTAQGGAGRRGRGAQGLHRLGRHRQPAQGADGRVEGRAARRQGGRAEALGTVPGRPGRVLQPPQRGLLRPRRRAEGQPGAQAGAAGRGRGARRRRRPAGRPGQAAGHPGASGTRPAGCPARPPPGWTAGCGPSTTRSATAMDAAWRRTTPEANPLLAQMRAQVAEAEDAAGPGPGRRRRHAGSRRPSRRSTEAAVPPARRAGRLTLRLAPGRSRGRARRLSFAADSSSSGA